MRSKIVIPEPCLRAYPTDGDVFAGDVARYRRHMVPLLSVDLSEVNSAWSGWIHVVSPHEPDDGVIGGGTHAYHAGYLRENWLAFRLDEHDRYHLLGDWRFFYAECSPPVATEKSLQHLRMHTERLERRYQARKARFLAEGTLLSPCPGESYNLVEQIGGSASFDNWCSMSGRGSVSLNIDDAGDVYPVSTDGRRFYFVCLVEASHYDHHECGIVLFFEPGSRTALLTFNWT